MPPVLSSIRSRSSQPLVTSANFTRLFSRQRMASIICETQRAAELENSIHAVQSKITAALGSNSNARNTPVLVAVSKFKPASDIMGCYQAGIRDLGENYVDELAEKASQLPSDIRWHFIGTLQSNKAKTLASIPNLYAIQTLTSVKTANALNKHLPSSRTSPLNVMIQVNTSGENSKSGLAPIDVEAEEASDTSSLEILDLANHVISSCKNLHLLGLMTIGSFEASTNHDELNPDFAALIQTRDLLESKLKESYSEGGNWGQDGKLLMSMGMSSDFEDAIRAGSDIVRVGTSIFGSRH